MSVRPHNWWRRPRITAADRAWAAHRASRPVQSGRHMVCLLCDLIHEGNTCPWHGDAHMQPCIGPRVPGHHFGCVKCNDEQAAARRRSA